MFDEKGDAELLGVMAEAQRDDGSRWRVDCAAGRLCQLRMADVDAEDRFQWCVDNWEAVASRGRRGTEDQPPPGLDADELRVGTTRAASEAGAVLRLR